jgi:hypothetical protein
MPATELNGDTVFSGKIPASSTEHMKPRRNTNSAQYQYSDRAARPLPFT